MSSNTKQDFTSNREMRRGLMISLSAGALLTAAIGLMLFAIGATQEQGDAGQPPAVDRFALSISMLMFAVANVVFWFGFMKMKKAMQGSGQRP